MPDDPPSKLHAHPSKSGGVRTNAYLPAQEAYAELSVTSNFTFLTGASHPEELVEQAAALGHRAASIADTNSLAGIVRAHVAAKSCGIPLAVGCRIVLADGNAVLVYPENRAAYARLCGLLTLGKRRAPKGSCHLELADLLEHNDGMLAVAEPEDTACVRLLREAFGERLSLGFGFAYDGADRERLGGTVAMGRRLGVRIAAVNRVLYHSSERRMLQDVVTCIRHGCTIEQAGLRLESNAERHLKSGAEMQRLFAGCEHMVDRAVEIAERASAFSLDELRYQYPEADCPDGMSETAYLRQEAFDGARQRYGGVVPARVEKDLDYELALIEELAYESYFLTCYEIVAFARSRGILCQGRGGAANSAVCYCLGITEVDPAKHDLLFERFISRERNEPPDIDIDFEHERREEVLQFIYSTYGRDRAALTAEVISYRGRSAVREVAKAMGLSADCVDALAKNLDRWGESTGDERVRELGLDPDEPTMRRVIDLSKELVGFPRHLSQHVGGFVITRRPLHELVPIENAAMDERTVIEWDKDDIDAMGMLKVDCLGLGMLSCIRKSFGLLAERGVGDTSGHALSIASVMDEHGEDSATYDMICRGDTVGVFQIESRAQMSMLPRLKPREFYDLVIEVAIVRPGPIQGGMVHPYLRRREGKEPVEFPSAEVQRVLGRTLGVPLFQEQAMRMAIVAAGFTPDEADGLRKAMAAWKRTGNAIARYGEKLIDGMLANGYQREYAERCFNQIKGFSQYGFPESHAASFAILVYVSAWLKRHHPAAFAAALINSQPMGFYRPAQIVRDAKEHGVEVRPVDVNRSAWDCTLEDALEKDKPAIRLGMRLVKGLSEEDALRVHGAVGALGPFDTVEGLWRASGAGTRGLRRLARADAFGSMHLDQRRALWQIKTLHDDRLPLFEQRDGTDEIGLDRLPELPAARRVLADYDATGLSLAAHPVSFVRRTLEARGVSKAELLGDAERTPDKSLFSVAGLVLCRQRPSTAAGVVFLTLEDETGVANLIVWRDTFEKYRKFARLSTALLARGRIAREGIVAHLHVSHLEPIDRLLPEMVNTSRDFH